MTKTTRADDERLLHWIKLRRGGWPLGRISREVGCLAGRNAVGAATDRVLQRDLEQSGEDPEIVRAAYWKRYLID